MIGRLRQAARARLQQRVLPLIVRPVRDFKDLPTVVVDSAVLPKGLITSDSVCYSGGVGENIEIEQYLAEEVGAHVWAFDPTPRSIAFMARASYDRSRIHFVPVGLWSEETTLRFNAPENPLYVSHSVVEELGGKSYFDAPVKSIPRLMRESGHTSVDFLKLNIEGAEDVVMKAMLESGIKPKVLVLTYEGPGSFRKAVRWTALLRTHGYALIARNSTWFTYVKAIH